MTNSRPPSLPTLWKIVGFLKPYKVRLIFASIALLLTAGATLSMVKGVQVLIDQGFGGDSAELRYAIGF